MFGKWIKIDRQKMKPHCDDIGKEMHFLSINANVKGIYVMDLHVMKVFIVINA